IPVMFGDGEPASPIRFRRRSFVLLAGDEFHFSGIRRVDRDFHFPGKDVPDLVTAVGLDLRTFGNTVRSHNLYGAGGQQFALVADCAMKVATTGPTSQDRQEDNSGPGLDA